MRTDFVRSLRAAIGAGSVGANDAELLRQFRDTADQDAFAELVHRHGPMVLDVSRSALGNDADAEDAFQATFLVLAENTGSIRRADSLAAWLHGVAYRIARKAQAQAARRREREARMPRPEPARTDDLNWAGVRMVVHEALGALDERYRAPLVLCYLSGMAQKQAAAALGVSEAALKKRLERGRQKLREELTRRGLGPTAVLAVVAMPAGPVPAALGAAVVRAAALFAADRSAAARAIPAAVMELASGGTRPVLTLKSVMWLCVVPAIALGLALPVAFGRLAAPPAPTASAAELGEEVESLAQLEAQRLAGGWKVRRVETNGRTVFPPAGKEASEPFGGEGVVRDDDQTDARIVFAGTKARVEGVRVLFVGDFSFRLDPTKNPKEIDVTFTEGERKGETFAGVYVARADELRICLRLTHTELGRPAGFVTSGGPSSYTFVLGPVAVPAPQGLGPEKKKGPRPAIPEKAVPQPDAPAKSCRVTGTLASSEYAKAGGRLDRAIVSVVTDPGGKRVAHSAAKGAAFAFDLPRGDYVLECTGVGTRGATFVPTDRKITVNAGVMKLDVGEIDLPASKVTKLFGRPAPELNGVVAWKNTGPLTMKGLKGKVVVLDFWSYSCTICLHHKPALANLAAMYKDKGLVALAVHGGSADTMEEVDQKVPAAIRRKAGHLPVALDGKGAEGIFGSYGITAVPMVVLIDQGGNVVRRFHHAGDPDLAREVERLLGVAK